MTNLICSVEGCDNPLGRRNTSGFCGKCVRSELLKARHQNPVFAYQLSQRMKALQNDPAFIKAREEGIARRRYSEEGRARVGAHARDPEFQRRAAEAKREKRFQAGLASLDANGRACFDRCIAGGLDRKLALQLARDEMRIYARAASRMGEAA